MPPISGEQATSEILEGCDPQEKEMLEKQLLSLGLLAHSSTPLPRQMIAELVAKNTEDKAHALELLQRRSNHLKAAVVKSSKRSVASGIRC